MKIAELEERGCRNRDDVAIRLSGNSQERAWFGAMDGKGLVSLCG